MMPPSREEEQEKRDQEGQLLWQQLEDLRWRYSMYTAAGSSGHGLKWLRQLQQAVPPAPL